MELNKAETLKEIKTFLDGRDNDLMYLVNVETNSHDPYASCIIHEPDQDPKIIHYPYRSFLYIKDLEKNGIVLFNGDKDLDDHIKIKYHIIYEKLETGRQKRLEDGYCYRISTDKSFNAIIEYLKAGGLDIYEKELDEKGKPKKDKRGFTIMPNKQYVFYPTTNEQFFISTGARLFKGFEEYNQVHRLTYDIESTGLNPEICRVFAIGVRNNRGFEKILEVEKINDDESERNLIIDFFNLVNYLTPATIAGHNIEEFDFPFILTRAKLLGINLSQLPTGLNDDLTITRRPNTSVKFGNTSQKYTSTQMWGYSIIDTLHAAKKTAAVNTDLQYTNLKYVAKFEKIAKPNRTYIPGDEGLIGKYYLNNDIFIANENNDYLLIPAEFQAIAKKYYKLQINKDRIPEDIYREFKKEYVNECPEFIRWFQKEGGNRGIFVSGKNLVKQYLLDDLWETEQVDELYNQSSFMLAKIVPTTYHRICTMGTAGIWNLLLTEWSYVNNLAIPICDTKAKFSGGLARCLKAGYCKRIKKIDYGSLYPMIQMSENVFPLFDISGVIKKMLLYLTTTRNIYKRLANGDTLSEDELQLLKEIDHESYNKYINNEITDKDKAKFKVKQLPIKILNNSLFGALGADIAFNWSDNTCAARITCTGRLHLRHAISFFQDYGCIALLAVTDGINFSYPEKTRIRIDGINVLYDQPEDLIENMWKYGNKVGMDALIEKYNTEELKSSFMKVDDDGDAIASLNLSRINYANLVEVKDKKTGELKEKIKLTGNTIKSKTMPEYMEEFIDKGLNLILRGKGKEFVDYYYDYCADIRYMQIPLKKIASRNKVKNTFKQYHNRGKDKNGRDKAIQAHMELLLEQRDREIVKLFEEHKNEFELSESQIANMSIENKAKYISVYMSPEPELDSYVYYINTGYKKSHGDSKRIKDKYTGEERFASVIINNHDLANNADLKGEYNYAKYLSAFNDRVKSLLMGFKPGVREKILTKLDKNDKLKTEVFLPEELELVNYDLDSYTEAMELQPKEVEFWNATGYDPRKIWNGFKFKDNYKVHYEIYEDALMYLNNIMKENNKPLIKSVNDEIEMGDYILYKHNNNYSIGYHNGNYVQIVRDDVYVPKHRIQIELETKEANKLKLIESLKLGEISIDVDALSDIYINDEDDIDETKHDSDSIFIKFKKEYNIPMTATKEKLFAVSSEIKDLYSLYVDEMNDEITDDEDKENKDVKNIVDIPDYIYDDVD